jgi:MoaA/NifB/PqqE/SkfB family radical SAM enzyme
MRTNSTTVLKEQSLELWHKLFQVSLWDDIKKSARGENPDAPLIVEIDPTSFCDLACPECNSIEVLRQKSFSSERFLELAQECIDMGVRGVILSGGGEPLIHPATPELIKLLSLGGVQVGLVSNGTQLGRYSELLAQHCSWIRISVDAGSPEVYQRFRPSRSGENHFSRIVNNIQDVASDATRRTRIGYSFLTLIRLDDKGELIFLVLFKTKV